MRVFYSSVKHMPFHWSTPPYPRNAAGLATASSTDGGRTWKKHAKNPILQGEPESLDVSGFRDPYVAEWPVLDEALGKSQPSLYGIVSGGIEGKGPTSFLYDVSRNGPIWSYISPLVNLPLRYQPSKKWSGNFGVNWECVNFLTLSDKSDSKHFMIIGVEGDVEKSHMEEYRKSAGLPVRHTTAQLWMSGTPVSTSDGVRFQPSACGILDHGRYYAANSFVDPVTSRRIVYGWIPEQDITPEDAKRKGWNGAIAIPREVFLLRHEKVKGTLRSDLSALTCFERVQEPDGLTTLLTLGIKPIEETSRLREQHRSRKINGPIALPSRAGQRSELLFRTQSPTWELEATIDIKSNCKTTGLILRHNDDLSICTTVTFSVIDESITVDHSRTTSLAMVDKCPDSGPFTLFTYEAVPDVQHQIEEMEKLRLRVFFDGDILEVFANDRFALATMVYSDVGFSSLSGITAFATGEVGSAVFEHVGLWDVLGEDLESHRRPLRL